MARRGGRLRFPRVDSERHHVIARLRCAEAPSRPEGRAIGGRVATRNDVAEQLRRCGSAPLDGTGSLVAEFSSKRERDEFIDPASPESHTFDDTDESTSA